MLGSLCMVLATHSLLSIPLDKQFGSGEASGGGDSPQISLSLAQRQQLVGLVVSGFYRL